MRTRSPRSSDTTSLAKSTYPLRFDVPVIGSEVDPVSVLGEQEEQSLDETSIAPLLYLAANAPLAQGCPVNNFVDHVHDDAGDLDGRLGESVRQLIQLTSPLEAFPIKDLRFAQVVSPARTEPIEKALCVSIRWNRKTPAA